MLINFYNFCPISRQFFSGPHFINWLSQREGEIRDKLHSLHIDAIINADFNLWVDKRSEVEIVDMIISLNHLMVSRNFH